MPTYTPSDWGYVHSELIPPNTTVYGPGPWGYVVSTLANPSPPPTGKSPSPWGTVVSNVRPPHHPVAVLTNTGLRYTKILTKTASGLEV